MPIELVGDLNDSPLWRTVRDAAEKWLEARPTAAVGWTISIRRKCPSDDETLVVECEGDDPRDYWAVYVDPDARHVTVAVAADGDDDLTGPGETTEFVLALLCGAANSDVDDF